MSKEFNRPSFLRPETNIEPQYSDPESGERHFMQGAFTVVGELKKLPSQMRQRVPEGFVLKQYYIEEYSSIWNELFDEDAENLSHDEWVIKNRAENASLRLGHSPSAQEVANFQYLKSDAPISEDEVAKVLEKTNLEAKAEKLKKRYQRIQGYFQDQIPDVIVPTQFIIGAERNKQNPNSDGHKHLYELQPQIKGLELEEIGSVGRYIEIGRSRGQEDSNFLEEPAPIPEDIIRIIKKWANQIKANLPNNQKQIKDELLKFIAIARPIPEDKKEIPCDMAHPFNLKFTKEGVRVIDINFVLTDFEDPARRKRHHTDRFLARYYRSLDIWQIVADEL